VITRIEIERNGNEYHVENIQSTSDIELFLNGVFIASYCSLLEVFAHCCNDKQFEDDMGYVARNRN
jgi:hypothetical protein